MRKCQVAIHSISTRHADIAEALSAYHAAGFENVELALSQVYAYLESGHSVADVRRLLDENGMRCVGGHECAVKCFAPPPEKKENHARVVRNARLLGELGATTMVVGTDGPPNVAAAKDPLGQMAKVFAGLGRQIEKTGVTLCIEFNWSPLVKSLRTACEIARRSGMSNVGVLFDPAHYHCTPTKLNQINAENVPYIRHVHVDDMRDKPGELSNCNSDRVLPGEGCLDLKGIFRRIEKHGYRGYFSIEMFNDKLWAMPARRAAGLMYKSMLQFCGGRR